MGNKDVAVGSRGNLSDERCRERSPSTKGEGGGGGVSEGSCP